jgi:hypothetical protein
MGPCGGLGGLEAEVSEGHPVSLMGHQDAMKIKIYLKYWHQDH